jgi:cold shock CspA family protein
MSSKDTVTSSASSERLTGRVKWFNNKAGYGFITVTDGSLSGSDTFVHHSAIGVSSQQYKYLVQGEYVDFELSSTQGGAHEFQATNVAGIKGGKLMCETRHEFKVARSTYKTTTVEQIVGQSVGQVSEPVTVTRQRRVPNEPSAPRVRGEGPRGEAPRDSEKKDWTFVKGKQPEKPVSKPRGRPPRTANTESK